MKTAVLVAVEEYAADDIKDVRFARNDAERFAEALAAVGFDEAARKIMISRSATKTDVESRLRETIGSLATGDTFFLYYAGHGFRGGARNFLTCHDTDSANLEATSVELGWILELLREANSQKVVVFLDSCHGGLLGGQQRGDEANGLFGDRADGELETFFSAAKDRACFASSASGQVSWGSRRNKHGAWTFNVIEALRGEAPAALMNGTSLTSASLQDYLDSAVQKTLRGDFVERRDQTPWMCGSSDFELADLGPVLHARRASRAPAESQVPRLAFCGETNAPIKGLSGYKAHQRVPTELSRYAEGLAREASSEEINGELKSIYRRLRDEFDLRRKDLERVGPEDGGGSIACPYFTFNLHVTQDPADPSRVVFHREISDISEPGRILDSAFGHVFGGMFGSLRFTPPLQIDLDKFIDRMEDLGDPLQSLDFDAAGTYCKVRLNNVDALIKVTATEILLVHDTSKEPRVLIDSFTQSQQFLVETHDDPLIAFDR